ncbi:STYKc [Nesidiocoris tenuis]|uniref:dual-specificity kinase n=1 Tax=Nesidiocoris tenuis TaxID=355587 RepID=A0ABN7B6A5_9HEMI|nr:STYKc [Nesidiocoris tenuis]
MSDCKVTGSSCLALKSAVSKLNRLDDFHMEKIGAGFFSEVFKVTHKVTGQVMVLKMNLLRSNRPNMLKEVQLMNQLSHPNILGFMGVCVHEGQLHALTEYINGGRLEQIVQDRSIPLPFCIRMKLALDIAKGMEYLHFKDIFHRDLTSKNILVRKNEETGEMTAVVGDFGFATKIPSFRCGYRLSTAGSPYWMSPECLKGKWYDNTSDIFSYGIVLCELIARVEADPDVLPRTENFGLDYIAFAKLVLDLDGPSPPQAFLKLAFTCCNYDPGQRPSFASIVLQLESIIWHAKGPQVDCLQSSSTSSPSSLSSPSCSAAPTKEHGKLCHRRSLSDDGIRVLSETMASLDKHYKPSGSQNPFANITSLKGGKKIVNHSSSDVTTSESDASFESGTVVAEPVVKPSKVLENLKKLDEEASLLDAIVTGRCFTSDTQFKKDRNERLMRLRSEEERRHASFLASVGVKMVGHCACASKRVMPASLPSSPTFARRTTPKPSTTSLQTHKLRHCSSGSNLPNLDDGLHCTTVLLRRRGSCESGFFSSVGEDFGLPGELIASSVTLSSSSAASSLLLDSGGAAWERLPHHAHAHHLRLTASSDDLSITSDILLEDRTKWTTTQRAQQIHKMVEYFERKGTSGEQQREYYRQLRVEPPRRRPAMPTHRLILCDGAVRSKLQIFDKK